MTEKEIYEELVRKNQNKDHDFPVIRLDPRSNVLWILDRGGGSMTGYWSPDKEFKNMSDAQIFAYVGKLCTDV